MVLHSKAPAKEQNKRIAYKNIKRKLGRKLPKIKKSKAMILPDQSVAAEKRKGLTLKDLLQQTSHCNAKLRKDALHGMKDFFKNHPAELQSHK